MFYQLQSVVSRPMLSSNSYDVTDSMGTDGNSWATALPSNEAISIDGSHDTANDENTSVDMSTNADISDDTVSDVACDFAESKVENSAYNETIVSSPKHTNQCIYAYF